MPGYLKIKKLLIANRGEIARRIHKACKEMGIETVLVVSEIDRGSLAASEVGEVVELQGSTAKETYLNAGAILDAARATRCDAIHPGYGFLSEDPNFAQAVRDSGLIFVGPSPESIRALGVKTTARTTVRKAGVPVTPGSAGGLSDEGLIEACREIGLPVIIKAAAGGGGRGMRIVREAAELPESIERARAEALKNFGSSEVYLERYIEEPRHVEVQLFGDQHGAVVHFGTRDCSAQRRHQKLVEEAPAPFLDEDTRERIHQAAVAAARSVGYYNAGTAEFLVQGREFYFLEINTRIQVEHPVTEAVTGVDLVSLQLRVATGERLPFVQSDIRFSGHAIELRINAEDVAEGFRPAIGTIDTWQRPNVRSVREDHGYQVGDAISPFYDSLVSKLIFHAPSRAEALYRAFEYIKKYSISGIPTTLPFHLWILSNEQFQTTGIDIGYVERAFSKEGAVAAQAFVQLDREHRAASAAELAYSEEISEGIALPPGAAALRIVHEPGGTFLGMPVSSTGEALPKETWCRSNTRAGVVRSVGGHDEL